MLPRDQPGLPLPLLVLPCAVGYYSDAVRVSSADEPRARLDAVSPNATPAYHRGLRSRTHLPCHDLRPLVYIQRQKVPRPLKSDAVPCVEPVDGGADYIACAVPY